MQINSDKDLCFFSAIHLEFNLGQRLVTQIKSFYPSSDIICVTDGTHYSEFEELCKINNVEYIQGKRLKVAKFGGAWVQRMLHCYLQYSKAKYLIKIEGDAILKRRFNYFPDEEIAGDYYYKSETNFFVHGGCRFHTRNLCEGIYKSEILLTDKYINSTEFTYQNPSVKTYSQDKKHLVPENLISEDTIIFDAVKELKFSIGKWDEIWSKQFGYCENPDQYAVIHPVKS